MIPPVPRRTAHSPPAIPVGPAAGCWRYKISKTRRLAAILAGEVAGYSRLMGRTRKAPSTGYGPRIEVIEPSITQHRGPHRQDQWRRLVGRVRQCRRRSLHSITSLARARIDCGTARPSVFAVLRLTTRSNGVGWTT